MMRAAWVALVPVAPPAWSVANRAVSDVLDFARLVRGVRADPPALLARCD